MKMQRNAQSKPPKKELSYDKNVGIDKSHKTAQMVLANAEEELSKLEKRRDMVADPNYYRGLVEYINKS